MITQWTRMMTTSRQLQPMHMNATNLTAINEYEDCDAEKRAPIESTPTTVCWWHQDLLGGEDNIGLSFVTDVFSSHSRGGQGGVHTRGCSRALLDERGVLKSLKRRAKQEWPKSSLRCTTWTCSAQLRWNPWLRTKNKSPLVAHVSQGEKGQFGEGANVCWRAQAEGWHLVKKRHYIADSGNGVSVHHHRYWRARGELCSLFRHPGGISACWRQRGHYHLWMEGHL